MTLLASCNTTASRKASAETVKVGEKTERVFTRTGEKIEAGSRKLGHKIQNLGELFEGNE